MYPARQGTRTPRARVHVPRAPKGKVHVPRASQGARTAPKDKHCNCFWLAPSQDACMLHAQVHARSRGKRQVQMTRAAGYMYLAGDGKHEHIYLVRGNTKLNVSLRGIWHTPMTWRGGGNLSCELRTETKSCNTHNITEIHIQVTRPECLKHVENKHANPRAHKTQRKETA